MRPGIHPYTMGVPAHLGDASFPGIDAATEAAIVADLRAGKNPSAVAAARGVSLGAVDHFKKKHGISGGSGLSWFNSIVGAANQAAQTAGQIYAANRAAKSGAPASILPSLFAAPSPTAPARSSVPWVPLALGAGALIIGLMVLKK